MSNDTKSTTKQKSEAGFSLIELVVVVGLIGVMAAVALPNIGRYLRTFKLRGATSQVGSELQTARAKAIMTNTNNGVLFVALDANSYRFIREDAPAAERLGPLRDLPQGVSFEAAPIGSQAIRYNRLGSWCKPSASTCTALPPPADLCGTEDGGRCDDQGPGVSYLAVDAANGVTISLLDANTGLRRTVSVSVGGRILTQS